MKQLMAATVLLFCVTLLGGCADFTAGFAPLDRTVDPAVVNAHARAGKVYCGRGWLGIFSTGMMTLSDRIDTVEGITAVSTADMEYWRLEDWLGKQAKAGNLSEPLVLLGHSWGADDMITVSEYLNKRGVAVDLLVLIDPVTPKPAPPNVKRVYCVYKSHPETDAFPFWRGVSATVQDPGKTTLQNIDLRTTDVGFDTSDISHPYVDKIQGVHDMCIKEILKVCPPRAVWLKSHPATPVTAGTALPTRPATP
jgi:pimeloyl-ACP methyl ester carboxylesterase